MLLKCMAVFFLYFVYFVIPMGIFPWEIWVASPRVALPNPNSLKNACWIFSFP